MNHLRFHYDMFSQPCRAIYVFFRVNGIQFESRVLDVYAGEHRTPEFAKINPRKRVPAITDGEFNLSESIAIVRYIIDEYRDRIPDHWYPRDLKARARVDEYLEYQHLGTRLHFSNLFIDEITTVRTGRETDAKQKEKLIKNVQKVTHIVQKTFLGDQQFFCGNEISLADLFAAQEILQIVGVGRDPVADQPKLAAWLERVSHKLNPHFAESLKKIYSFSDQDVPQKYKN